MTHPYMKPLVRNMSQSNSIFFITKAENDINKEKRQMRDHSTSLAFSSESEFRR